MEPKYFDIHAHLNFKDYDSDREEVIARCKEQGVLVNNVGTSLQTSEEVVALAEAHPHLYATVGVHPTDWQEGFDESRFHALATHSKVIAIGECGLDYFRITNESDKDEQKKLFEKHIALAEEVGKPLMLHIRPAPPTAGDSASSYDAYLDVLEILNAHPSVRAHAHFFAAPWSMAERFLARGIGLSFTGVITFTHDYDEVIQKVPLNMLIAETDAPFVAPVPYRGKRAEPLHVRQVVAQLATIRGVGEEELRQALLDNARRLFAIPL